VACGRPRARWNAQFVRVSTARRGQIALRHGSRFTARSCVRTSGANARRQQDRTSLDAAVSTGGWLTPCDSMRCCWTRKRTPRVASRRGSTCGRWRPGCKRRARQAPPHHAPGCQRLNDVAPNGFAPNSLAVNALAATVAHAAGRCVTRQAVLHPLVSRGSSHDQAPTRRPSSQ